MLLVRGTANETPNSQLRLCLLGRCRRGAVMAVGQATLGPVTILGLGWGLLGLLDFSPKVTNEPITRKRK
jgi:hypothetical protein